VGLPAGLPFSTPFDTNGDLWGVILEKAWGKVKGDITMSGQGGYLTTGLRSLVGTPSFYYYVSDDTDLDQLYQIIGEGDALGYPMGASTAGSGND